MTPLNCLVEVLREVFCLISGWNIIGFSVSNKGDVSGQLMLVTVFKTPIIIEGEFLLQRKPGDDCTYH